MPRGLALDGAGRLLVADAGNQLIRVVDPAHGTVATLAGGARARGHGDGPFADARFDTPVDVRLSPSGRLAFVVERSALRVLDLESKRVRTAVGAPGARGVRLGPLPASLSGPSAVLPLSDDAAIIVERAESALLLASGMLL
jgi:DNA-binding beta-propeller fold protein YncE